MRRVKLALCLFVVFVGLSLTGVAQENRGATCDTSTAQRPAPNDGHVAGVKVEAEVHGGKAAFPKANEPMMHCVPTSIARGISFLDNLTAAGGQERTDGPDTDVDTIEEEAVLALAAVGAWKKGGGTPWNKGVREYAQAKAKVLRKLGRTNITTEVIASPTPNKAFFRKLAEALADGAVIELHTTQTQSDDGKTVSHMSNVGRVVSHEGNWGVQVLDDPKQGNGKAELDWRAPRFWRADGTSYGLSQIHLNAAGTGPKVLPGYKINGALIQRLK